MIGKIASYFGYTPKRKSVLREWVLDCTPEEQLTLMEVLRTSDVNSDESQYITMAFKHVICEMRTPEFNFIEGINFKTVINNNFNNGNWLKVIAEAAEIISMECPLEEKHDIEYIITQLSEHYMDKLNKDNEFINVTSTVPKWLDMKSVTYEGKPKIGLNIIKKSPL